MLKEVSHNITLTLHLILRARNGSLVLIVVLRFVRAIVDMKALKQSHHSHLQCWWSPVIGSARWLNKYTRHSQR